MNNAIYYDKNYLSYLKELNESSLMDEGFEKSYSDFDERLEEGDLYGKTVKVTKNQFRNVYNIISELCNLLDMDYIDAYVYEDFYYGVESKGIKNKHLEISAKTIVDFELEELKFLIARELFSIKIVGLKNKIIIQEILKSFDMIKIPLATDTIKENFKITSYKYLRSLNYSCDNFGYIVVGELSYTIKAIMKTILNNKYLVNEINISEYLKQGDKISSLNDDVHIFTKIDEQVPYGPDRIKKLLAYAISKRGLESLKLIKSKGDK